LVSSALARGDRVIASARTPEKLEELAEQCNKDLRHNLRTIQLDVTEGEASIKVKADQAAAFWGQIDVLVNNAGEFLDNRIICVVIGMPSFSGIGLPSLLEEGG
jgi:short-subunit dehydrogenase